MSLLGGVQIRFATLEESNKGVRQRHRVPEEDKEVIRGFIDGLISGIHETFVVPVADKKKYAAIKRLIQLIAAEKNFQVKVEAHKEGARVRPKTDGDAEKNNEFRASLNGTIEDEQPVKKGR